MCCNELYLCYTCVNGLYLCYRCVTMSNIYVTNVLHCYPYVTYVLHWVTTMLHMCCNDLRQCYTCVAMSYTYVTHVLHWVRPMLHMCYNMVHQCYECVTMFRNKFNSNARFVQIAIADEFAHKWRSKLTPKNDAINTNAKLIRAKMKSIAKYSAHLNEEHMTVPSSHYAVTESNIYKSVTMK